MKGPPLVERRAPPTTKEEALFYPIVRVTQATSQRPVPVRLVNEDPRLGLPSRGSRARREEGEISALIEKERPKAK
jgi:hypothetical protein